MHPQRVARLLRGLRRGKLGISETLDRLSGLGFEDLGFAKVDHHRTLRRGLPEAIYGPGKSPEQIRSIALELAGRGHTVLVTRTEERAFRLLRKSCPKAVWHPLPRMIVVPGDKTQVPGSVAVLAAGTSDLPVAEEAACTLEAYGIRAERLYDVGVAGLHRLLRYRAVLLKAKVLLVAAGMDGALPSVVAGLTRAPVVAVPTSVGYGAAFKGLSALLAMLNSCAPGVAVVNIDNGYGAGYLAASMLMMGAALARPPAGRSRSQGAGIP